MHVKLSLASALQCNNYFGLILNLHLLKRDALSFHDQVVNALLRYLLGPTPGFLKY